MEQRVGRALQAKETWNSWCDPSGKPGPWWGTSAVAQRGRGHSGGPCTGLMLCFTFRLSEVLTALEAVGPYV